jgi:hypothetical protein
MRYSSSMEALHNSPTLSSQDKRRKLMPVLTVDDVVESVTIIRGNFVVNLDEENCATNFIPFHRLQHLSEMHVSKCYFRFFLSFFLSFLSLISNTFHS